MNSPTCEVIRIQGEGDNTLISFLYRDASNYKKFNYVVVEGRISGNQMARILCSLYEGLYFIPEQIGLPVERFPDYTEDDHSWCELRPYDFAYTEAASTVDINVENLTVAFENAKGKWDCVFYGCF